MSFHRITLKINGTNEIVDVPGNITLLQMLRDKLALTGTKNGCASGECGACTVIMNGDAVNSCMILAAECDGADITTVEGLSKNGELDALQKFLIETGGIQCGFCTPGVLMSAKALLNRNAKPSEDEIREALVGNLCRCTGYNRIILAVQKAAGTK
ncbi:MAG: (2Fe-2S)-binding protein [Anaerolineaceae bacterium]|nr:(2Fe-2S)-binding protein [Anaerolineaceae bacterium]NTV36719.1 (2Fe-2S)-binding protein [Anaerolineaceae bacterium]